MQLQFHQTLNKISASVEETLFSPALCSTSAPSEIRPGEPSDGSRSTGRLAVVGSALAPTDQRAVPEILAVNVCSLREWNTSHVAAPLKSERQRLKGLATT